MQIVAKKRLMFVNWEYSIHPFTKENTAKAIARCEVLPSLRTQVVPDWIVNDELFDLAVKDKSVVPVGPVPPKLDSTLESSQPTKSTEEVDAELAAMINTPIQALTGGNAQSVSYPRIKNWPGEDTI